MAKTEPVFPLRPGSECVLQGPGRDPVLARRLAQMGLVPGSRLQIVRLAPLGDTLEISADGAQAIALRASDLRTLDCRPIALPLPVAATHWGGRLRVRRLLGGRTFLEYMAGLGIRPGVELEADPSEQRPLRVVLLRDRKPCALGPGQAQKLIVAPADDPDA